ncbi:Uu.00g139510.m01.CDS01 [Anthostomella pinea]|uniref:Uu.00g139510.m01.CDS01 n=1 Tax=Anthostomella pinea TaxID=933095 RepID=A0AAI8VPZ1_9PEZI|nr:Uu.00g139510.m01.CDS01 [Anthostomella pinea]
MKCRLDSGNTCRRCQRSGVQCIFLPRANAATLPESLVDFSQIELNGDILRRLRAIETHLGLTGNGPESPVEEQTHHGFDGSLTIASPEEIALSSLWEAVGCLEKISVPLTKPSIWRRSTIKHLWLAFHDRMPGLHFLPEKQTFSSPRPLLLASILYCSSARGPPDMAETAPQYFSVLCNAIAQLSVPNSEIGRPPENPQEAEEWAFQTVLGIILAGLLTEANIRETGIWISVAYRLILEHCPPHIDERSREWRKLFIGTQIIDLEHASLHLTCPVIPIEPPLQALKTSNRDQLYRLSRMMHTGLTHFTGRGLPTIWSCFTSNPPETMNSNSTCTFNQIDAAVIRDWARQLDDWLVEFSNVVEDADADRTSVFRQYVLHRLVVLSIYHPARGCNLYSNTITPKEQHELLLSARATIRLHLNDSSIWSNWDLVIITWAALIVIQGVEGEAGEPDDLRNIRIHLDFLKQTSEPKPSLRDKLITRLEQSLTGVQTPTHPSGLDPAMNIQALSPELEFSWQIFDHSSLRQMQFPGWPDPSSLQPMQ